MIYFAQMEMPGAPIKIGYTTKGEYLKRKQLHSYCPYPITFLAMVPGTTADEKALHRRFRAHRVRGEWFHPVPELLAVIAGYASDSPSVKGAM